MIRDLIKKLESWRDYSKENQCSGLKEYVVYERILREVNELQINLEIRDRILAENIESAIKNYFINKISRGDYSIDCVDCNADLQKILKEQFEKLLLNN